MKYTIGVDLGGTNIAAGVLDENYVILAKGSVKTEVPKGFEAIADSMAALCLRLVKEAGLTPEQISSIGVGSPGTSDKETGDIVFAGNLHWDNVPLGRSLAKKTGIAKVYVGNDADCAALGEFVVGAGKEFSSLVMITIGTGVGGGVILENKLFAPAGTVAPELGHTTLIYGGESCTCGRSGCLEAYASFTALIRDANRAADKNPESRLAQIRAAGERLNGKNIFVAAKQGDAVAKTLVDNFINYIAQGAANFANAFGPQAVVIGGGISKEGDYVADRIHAILEKEMFSGEKYAPVVKMASLGNDAGVIGAAALESYR